MTTFKRMTDAEIIAYNEKTPCIKPSGECWVVRSVELFIDEDVAEVVKVTDVNVVDTEGKAHEQAARMTYASEDAEYAQKHVFIVEPRWIDLE